jgi:hypothetical protein
MAVRCMARVGVTHLRKMEEEGGRRKEEEEGE